MPVEEDVQREAKRGFVRDALERIGGFRDVVVDEVVAVGPVLGYRTKVELTAGRDRDGGRALGYHRVDDPAELIDVPRCAIAHPALAALVAAARDAGLDGDCRLGFRASRSSGETLVAVRGWTGSPASLRAFATAAMRADPRLAGVVRIETPEGRRGGATSEVVAGRGWIEESLSGIRFRVPAGVFLQVHAGAAERLAADVVAGLGAARNVVELYGGIGWIGLAAARAGRRVTIVDADAEAVACGEEAARAAGIDATFRRGDVLRFLERDAPRSAPDVVVADPPRTGFGPGVAARLSRWAPARIVIVSCDPATLARDCARLRDGGYAITSVTPYDLFPQTAHVETVVGLSRARPPRGSSRREGSC